MKGLGFERGLTTRVFGYIRLKKALFQFRPAGLWCLFHSWQRALVFWEQQMFRPEGFGSGF